MKIVSQLRKFFSKSKSQEKQLAKFRKFPNWKFAAEIGRGTFSTVHLLRNKDRRLCVKVVDAKALQEDINVLLMECYVHKPLHHVNIIDLVDWEVQRNFLFVFIEYAAGGSLLDKFDGSISKEDAHRFFQQLMDGVEFLHQHGIAHRDLKPANLLFDDLGTLKIADFGMAVVYRRDEESVPLTDICGTAAYMAPEVFTRHYDGEAADVWSCGVILVNLLTGVAPWDEPLERCRPFASWAKSQSADRRPWTQMDDAAFDLVKDMLQPEPKKRATVKEIKSSKFLSSL